MCVNRAVDGRIFLFVWFLNSNHCFLHYFLNFYLYLQLNLRLGLGSIKPSSLSIFPSPWLLSLSLSLSLSGKEWKNRSPKLFFSDNDTDNKSWSGPYIVDLVLVWMADVDVRMCTFCYSFIFQIKVLNCLCLLFFSVFLGISGVRIDLEVIHTVSLKKMLPPN